MCGFCSRANNPAQSTNAPVLRQSLSNAATGAALPDGVGSWVGSGVGVRVRRRSSGSGSGSPTVTVRSATSSCEPAALR